MLKLVALAFSLWITATLVATWIGGLRTGVASLIGPYVRVRRQTHPVSYVLALVLLFIPAAIGVGSSVVGFKMAFPPQWIPAPPARGYAEPISSASQLAGYFPSSLTLATYKCAEFPKAVPLLSRTEAAWYSGHLTAAGEPSLTPARESGKSTQKVYRFTWLRSFDPPIIVRIQDGSGGIFVMTASRLSGKGGYEPGTVDARVERTLTASETAQFRRALAGANELKLKAVTCDRGSDGAEWIFEARDGGAYRYVNRWSPKSGPMHTLGTVMLSFTGWPFDADY